MSRKKTLKPEPGPDFPTVVANKKRAAIGQLESAILLWFNEAEPISILVLTTNSHNCFHAIGKNIGKPAFYETWIQSLPKPLRDEYLERSNYIQNFAKHGFMDLDEDANWGPGAADALIMFSIDSCQFIYGAVTPLMRLFRMRFYFENPRFAPKEQQDQFWQGATVHGMGSGSRKEFFDNVGKRLLENVAAHLRKPPELEPVASRSTCADFACPMSNSVL